MPVCSRCGLDLPSRTGRIMCRPEPYDPPLAFSKRVGMLLLSDRTAQSVAAYDGWSVCTEGNTGIGDNRERTSEIPTAPFGSPAP